MQREIDRAQSRRSHPRVFQSVITATYKEHFAYRSTMAVSLFVHPIFFLVQYFIWQAVFKVHSTVSGFNLEQMLYYYAVSSVVGFLTWDNSDGTLQRLIQTGKFITFQLRPVSNLYYAFLQKVGHRILAFWLELLPIIGFYLLFGIKPIPVMPGWALISLLLSFTLSFLVNYTIGAGKSTTLKILTGILYPTSGSVNIMGYTPWKDRRKYVAHIGAVFGQKSQLLWDIPPLDAFYLNQSIYGIPEASFRKTMNEMVEMLEIQNMVKKPTRQLSLGERMKCEFVMAMLHNPRIVFLDEPTIGLDVIAKEKIREFILEQNKKGITFILTTHDLEDVEHLAKRVIVVNHGEIVFDNTMDNLRTHLGDKKAVHITTRKKLPSLEQEGIFIRNKVSDYDAEVELDLSVVKLNEFIHRMNEESIIIDMSIERLEIEHIIKDLYQQA